MTVRIRHLVVACALVCPTGRIEAQVVFYVDQSAIGARDGSTWFDAYQTLDLAIEAAAASGQHAEVRVSGGTYLPNTDAVGDPRDATFRMQTGVAIRGGYAGLGHADPDQRDIKTFETILDGDLQQDDNLGSIVFMRGDNCRHVVTAHGTESSAVLDGFTVKGGFAEGEQAAGRGAGLYAIEGSPTIRNCLFWDNAAFDGGSALAIATGTPVIDGCIFRNNGGESTAWFLASNPRIHSCEFEGNDGFWVIWLNQGNDFEITKSTFSHNMARPVDANGIHGTILESDFIENFGGVALDGGNLTVMDCHFEGSELSTALEHRQIFFNEENLVVRRCTFIGNTGGTVGALRVESSHAEISECSFLGNSGSGSSATAVWGSPDTIAFTNCLFAGNQTGLPSFGTLNLIFTDLTLTNCVFWDNEAPQVRSSEAVIRNCIFSYGGLGVTGLAHVTDSLADVQFSCFHNAVDEGGPFGGLANGNLRVDPAFIEPAGPDGFSGTMDDDFRLKVYSPCVDAGFDKAVSAATDLAGHPRIAGPAVDMGAYETAPFGDLDCSFSVDVEDVMPFVTAVLGPWQSDACRRDLADVNGDGAVNGDDVAAFTELLLSTP